MTFGLQNHTNAKDQDMADWRNRRKRPEAQARKKMFSVRVRDDLQDDLKRVVRANNSTVAAATEYMIESFLRANDPMRRKAAKAAPPATAENPFD